MKKHYALLLLSILSHLLIGQTGSIKIAKPNPPPAKKNNFLFYHAFVECNYTFKNNKKTGLDAGFVAFPKLGDSHLLGIGCEWDYEYNYYQLSAFDTKTQQPAEAIKNSQTTTSYLKLPIEFRYNLIWGRSGAGNFNAGIVPKYLLKTTNTDRRLSYSDFNQWNVAWYVGFDRLILHRHYSIGLRYSNDLFENLKDKKRYDASGTKIGTQKTKTHLLGVSLKYVIQG